jgi:hypothetical protein
VREGGVSPVACTHAVASPVQQTRHNCLCVLTWSNPVQLQHNECPHVRWQGVYLELS